MISDWDNQVAHIDGDVRAEMANMEQRHRIEVESLVERIAELEDRQNVEDLVKNNAALEALLVKYETLSKRL